MKSGTNHPRFGRVVGMEAGRCHWGFTLVEMLLAVAIIVLLVAMVLPMLGRSRYSTRVTVCLSNYHQWGHGIVSYATNHRQWLPRQDFARSTGFNTWDVSNELPVQMVLHGVNLASYWDCPATPRLPVTVTTMAEAQAHFKLAYGDFSIIPHNWWVPRKGGSGYYPSLATDPTGDPLGWPTRMGGSKAAMQPVLTCQLSLAKALPPNSTAEGCGGGHRMNNKLETISILYADGHAVLQALKDMKRRYSGNWHNFY